MGKEFSDGLAKGIAKWMEANVITNEQQSEERKRIRGGIKQDWGGSSGPSELTEGFKLFESDESVEAFIDCEEGGIAIHAWVENGEIWMRITIGPESRSFYHTIAYGPIMKLRALIAENLNRSPAIMSLPFFADKKV